MMTNTLRDRIAKVLSDTLLAPISMCDAEVLAEAVIAALGEAKTVTTPDQLASLPFLAVMRETYTSAAGWEHSLIWERRYGDGSWACIAAPLPPIRTSPHLPAVVLWPTDWNTHD
jgi:hypothetical protein